MFPRIYNPLVGGMAMLESTDHYFFLPQTTGLPIICCVISDPLLDLFEPQNLVSVNWEALALFFVLV